MWDLLPSPHLLSLFLSLTLFLFHTHTLSLSVFILCWVYSYVISFCFFSFFWDIFFFCAPSPSDFGTVCSFPGRVIWMRWGKLMDGLIQPWASLAHLRCFVQWMCSVPRDPTSQSFSSAPLSTFESMYSKFSALFLRHQSYIQPHCLAWMHLQTPTHSSGQHLSYTWWLFRYVYSW